MKFIAYFSDGEVRLMTEEELDALMSFIHGSPIDQGEAIGLVEAIPEEILEETLERWSNMIEAIRSFMKDKS